MTSTASDLQIKISTLKSKAASLFDQENTPWHDPLILKQLERPNVTASDFPEILAKTRAAQNERFAVEAQVRDLESQLSSLPVVTPASTTQTAIANNVVTPASTTQSSADNSPKISTIISDLSSQAQKIFSGSNSLILVLALVVVFVGVLLK